MVLFVMRGGPEGPGTRLCAAAQLCWRGQCDIRDARKSVSASAAMTGDRLPWHRHSI